MSPTNLPRFAISMIAAAIGIVVARENARGFAGRAVLGNVGIVRNPTASSNAAFLANHHDATTRNRSRRRRMEFQTSLRSPPSLWNSFSTNARLDRVTNESQSVSDGSVSPPSLDPLVILDSTVGGSEAEEDEAAQSVVESVVEPVVEPSVKKSLETMTPSVPKILSYTLPAIGVWLCSPVLSMIDTASVGLLGGTAQQAALNPAVSVTDYGALVVVSFYDCATKDCHVFFWKKGMPCIMWD